MTVYVDELTLAIPGNLVKKFDGTTTTLRVPRAQLDEIAKVVAEAQALFAKTEPSPPEAPKTAEEPKVAAPTGGSG